LCIETARLIWGLIKSLRGKLDWVTGIKILFGWVSAWSCHPS
jgi:hypothetical protein